MKALVYAGAFCFGGELHRLLRDYTDLKTQMFADDFADATVNIYTFTFNSQTLL